MYICCLYLNSYLKFPLCNNFHTTLLDKFSPSQSQYFSPSLYLWGQYYYKQKEFQVFVEKEQASMESESCVPPGFRFHPTEEELVGYYLRRKINSLKIDLDVIVDIDLYRLEPWDIQDRCKLGYEEQNEWYFFSHKDRKYPTGRRTNRATTAGFWKATGRDKAVLSKESIIGMRKTLVFYKGRAPNGMRSDWIMHEYRLQSSEHGPPQEEGWVVCRAFKKPTPNQKQGFEPWNNGYYFQNNNNFSSSPSFQEILNPLHAALTNQSTNFYQVPFANSNQQQFFPNDSHFDNEIVDLPQLDSPTLSVSLDPDQENCNGWKNLDKLLAPKPVEHALFSFPNMPLVPCEDELDAQNHLNHFLGYFPEL